MSDDESRNGDHRALGDTVTADSGEPSLSASIEAILVVVDEPIDEVTLAQVLEVPREEIATTLRRLAQEYTDGGRGFELRSVAGGWRLYTRAECAPVVERFVLDGQQARLTQAALETLAVVAYRQPVSRARISAIRGVNCDGVMRTLTTRGLVEEAGIDHESGATLFRTSSYFLERLGMTSLEDLPPLAQYLPDIDDLEGEGESTGSSRGARNAGDLGNAEDLENAVDLGSAGDLGDAEDLVSAGENVDDGRSMGIRAQDD
nr:SMC-Scp complex subunit ScpB [Phytoactinopolyspora endophytica]